MISLHRRAGVVLGVAVFAATAVAAARPTRAPAKITDTTLPNGLRVLIQEDHAAPVFSIVVNYNVGSRNERQGRTGFAHLFEHMMFKGSENVGQNEHPYLMFMNGGNMNGTTDKDRTLYYETLPSNQVDLALFLEADRMRSLSSTITKENLENQINAVQEERRLRVDNVPYGKVLELLPEMAYQNFGYKHSVIGSMADLSAATVQDVVDFFRMYYAPNNAILAIVGDVDTKTTLEKVKKYFNGVARQPNPPKVDETEPAQNEERRQTLDDALARLPRLDMAYHVPAASSADYDALTVLSSVLSSGRSSRLYESIVRQQQLATGAFAGVQESRGPGLFQVQATPTPGKSVAELEAAIDAEFEKVKNGPIADWELEKARVAARRSYVSTLGSSLARAVTMSQNAMFYNDPDLLAKRQARIEKVTAADVQRVAKQYLVKTNRSVVVTMPKTAGRGGN
jgi:predicted Zn-dependent peptidase